MSKSVKIRFATGGVLFALFILLIILVRTVDVQAIGPQGTAVGLATLNGAVNKALGYDGFWEKFSDVTLYAALAVAVVFAMFGLVQLIARKSLKKTDADLLLMGALYVVVAVLYVLFEVCVVSRRPVMQNGEVEASFPSSHTMVVFAVFASAMYQIRCRIKNRAISAALYALCAGVITVGAVARLFAGVHWFTDILGGLLISGALVSVYTALSDLVKDVSIRQG